MAQPALSGFGTWSSPVTSDIVASGAVRFDSQIAVSGHDTYWIESRPLEEGRSVIVRSRARQPSRRHHAESLQHAEPGARIRGRSIRRRR